MFYTDELRRLSPFIWLALLGLVFWAVIFFAWPFWTGVFLAIAFGILGSYLFGSWVRERIRLKIRAEDHRKRKTIQDEFTALFAGRKKDDN